MMKKILLLTTLLIAMLFTLSAVVTQATINKDYLVLTDVGSDTTPVNSYTTNVDGVTSDAFPGLYLNNRVFTCVAATIDTINGTNVTHITPIVQISGDGTTWADAMTLEAYSSGTFTTGNINSVGVKWAITVDFTGRYAPWIRIAYIYHTSADATVSDAAAGTPESGIIKTVIYSNGKK